MPKLKTLYLTKKPGGYRVERPWTMTLPFDVLNIDHKYFNVSENVLWIHKGYLFDGASGPVRDTQETIVPSLPHDFAYQAIREKLLPLEIKPKFDKLFADMIYERCAKNTQWKGLAKFRAKIKAATYLKGLELFGGRSCVPGDTPKILEFR